MREPRFDLSSSVFPQFDGNDGVWVEPVEQDPESGSVAVVMQEVGSEKPKRVAHEQTVTRIESPRVRRAPLACDA